MRRLREDEREILNAASDAALSLMSWDEAPRSALRDIGKKLEAANALVRRLAFESRNEG